MHIDALTLRKIFPSTPTSVWADIAAPLREQAEKYGVDTPEEMALFLSQVGVESGGFRYRQENLNYSKEGLLKTFKKYFNEDTAAKYAHRPVDIANRVYANRMGNGPESSGDGWKHRGLGFIQVTGKNNQTAFANDVGMTLDEANAYLNTIDGAIESAFWYWKKNDLGRFAAKKDVVGCTKAVNGGENGLEAREAVFERAMSCL